MGWTLITYCGGSGDLASELMDSEQTSLVAATRVGSNALVTNKNTATVHVSKELWATLWLVSTGMEGRWRVSSSQAANSSVESRVVCALEVVPSSE